MTESPLSFLQKCVCLNKQTKVFFTKYLNLKFRNFEHTTIRVWTGYWIIVIALLVAMFQGSILVKYFTRFTKELFSALVSLLYIFEALKKLSKVSQSNFALIYNVGHFCFTKAYRALCLKVATNLSFQIR